MSDFEWSEKKNNFLLDDKDLAYLNLDDNELYEWNNVFSQYDFSTPENLLNSVINYSYKNWMFAAKVFLGIDLAPFQGVVIDQLFKKNFVVLVGTRGFGKSYLLAVYALLKSIFYQGSKIVVVSASFRQSQVIFNYMAEEIYKRCPVLQQVSAPNSPKKDISMCSYKIGKSIVSCVPLGNGDKIRGLRADTILTDEKASIPQDVFEVVIRGFSVVSSDPVKKMKERARQKQLSNRGHDISDFKMDEKSNQIILSGTAYYQFNHFYEDYSKYKKIIECYNDPKELRKLMGDDVSDEELSLLDPRKFCVIRVPAQYLPDGFMDESIIAQGRATMTKANFEMEFGAVFYADSDGFYPRSLIDALSMFRQYPARLHGEKTKKYIMGVDPARQSDHFSITIIEVDESDSRRHKIVYCWATNEKKMKQSGEVNENQTYYGACAKKIRQLMDRFNIIRLIIDAGGGGREVANYLQEKQFLRAGEQPIWDIEDPDQSYYEGLHIMRLIASNTSWNYEANHSMKKSFEEFKLLFPIFDTVSIEKEFNEIGNSVSIEKMIKGVRAAMTDTLEDVSEEIEEQKNEISNIVVTATSNGNEHFDLPKLEGTQKGRTKDKRRKDRYSSCLLAHYGIKDFFGDDYETNLATGGGTKEELSKGVGVAEKENGGAIIISGGTGTIAY